MKNIKILIFILVCNIPHFLMAHSSQFSTITITKKDATWSLHISSSFDAFFDELSEKYPKTDFDKITKEALTDLLIKEVGKSIDITANKSDKLTLQNGAVQVGHQTDLWFDIKGIPENLKQLTVHAHTFPNFTQHNYVLLMPQKETYQRFILGANNDNTARFEWTNEQVFKQIPNEVKTPILYYALAGISLFAFGFLIFTKIVNPFSKIETAM